MSIERLARDVWRFELPTPFPVGPINTYFLDGQCPTLIDTGLKTDESEAYLHHCFERARFPVKGLQQILLTHGHVDHFGLAGKLRAETGAKILVHPAELSRVTDTYEDPWRFEPFQAFMTLCGFNEGDILKLSLGFKRIGRFVDPIAPDGLLEDGQEVLAGDRMLRIYHTPGHASGELLFHDEQSLDAFSGDFLLPNITPNPILDFIPETRERFLALPAQRRSLDRMSKVAISRVFPGHGPVSDKVQGMIAMNLRHHGIRAQKVLRMAHEDITVRDIMLRLFPRMIFSDTFLAISETIGHIDLLVEENALTLEPVDGVWELHPTKAPESVTEEEDPHVDEPHPSV